MKGHLLIEFKGYHCKEPLAAIIQKCALSSNIQQLPTEVGTFRSACLRQLFVFLPSGLLLSFCEASQAVGIHRVLGIGTRAWAGLDHSTIDPFQQLRCCLGKEHLWVQVAPYLPNWMQRRIAPMAWLVQQAPRA